MRGAYALVRGGSSTSNLVEPSRTNFDCTEPSLSTSLQGQQGMQGFVHLFGVVQAHRTSSNLLEPHQYKDSKVCRVLSHEFGVVRLYRTFSIYIVTEIARHAGCLCTSSGCIIKGV